MAEGKDKFWAEMSPKEQAAAKILGWDSKTWDDGDPEPMDGLFWESAHNEPPTTMTAAQIEAAQLLGHTTETWNHGMTQDDAATKIGAVFRGRKERKALAARKAEGAKAPLASGGDSAAPPPSKSRLCCCLDRSGEYQQVEASLDVTESSVESK